jgi:hypothetical protein
MVDLTIDRFGIAVRTRERMRTGTVQAETNQE